MSDERLRALETRVQELEAIERLYTAQYLDMLANERVPYTEDYEILIRAAEILRGQ